jgi:hypothetical protein
MNPSQAQSRSNQLDVSGKERVKHSRFLQKVAAKLPNVERKIKWVSAFLQYPFVSRSYCRLISHWNIRMGLAINLGKAQSWRTGIEDGNIEGPRMGESNQSGNRVEESGLWERVSKGWPYDFH